MGRFGRFAPIACVLLLAAVYLGWVFFRNGADPLAFVQLGTRFQTGDSAGTEGYDGQFYYYIAVDPDPQRTSPRLDVPAYRYQRLLYPLLARALAFGRPEAIPWTLLAINIAALAGLTFLAGEQIAQRGGSRWAAVAVGLWPGILASVRCDLAEPLALFLVLLALWIAGPALERRTAAAALLLALAVLAKDTVAPFLAGWIAWLAYRRNYSKAAAMLLAAVPYGVLQLWLWAVFGTPGVFAEGSGLMFFQWLPFGGFLTMARISLLAFAVYFIVYLPGVILPVVYGTAAALADILRRAVRPEGLLLLAHALIIAFAPFDILREPLGMLRLASGLVLCMWLYAAAKKNARWNTYGWIGMVYLLFLR
jgi:hypothetical protein